MGRIAAAFGVGIKGALFVVLERGVFNAGEVVQGVVTLRVTKPIIQCRELVLSVEGTERIAWREQHGKESRRYSRTNEFLCDKIVLSTQTTYEPGEYTFGFYYRLHESLPASVAFSDRRIANWSQIDASTLYTLKATLPVTTIFSSDLDDLTPIEVFALPIAHQIKSVSESASKNICRLGLFSRGECEVSAQLDQDAFVAGEAMRVQTSVHNRSRINMSSVSLKFYEQLTMTVPGRSHRQGTKCIFQANLAGLRAGDRQDQVLALPLVNKWKLTAINPTNLSGTFAQWTYKLVVKCNFTLASSVKVEIPVVVLPRAQFVIAEPAPTAVKLFDEVEK